MDIVLKLRELRRLRGLSQKEAAELSGVGEKTLSSFETGERIASMKVLQLLQLLTAYDITPDAFFDNGVERQLFAESVNASEMRILTALRAIPVTARAPVVERVLAIVENASAAPSHLRAIQ